MPTACTPGNCSSLRRSMLLNASTGGLRGVLLLRQAVRGGERVIGAEAQVDGAHLLKAAQQQAGGGKQHQGHRELGDHQGRAQARMAAARGARASAFFQSVVDARCARRTRPE